MSTNSHPLGSHHRAGVIGLYAFLVVSALFFLLPLIIVGMNSLKPMAELRGGNFLSLPAKPTFDAWISAWKTACTGLECSGVRPGFLNSFKITVPAVIISTLVGALNGYALAQWRSPRANVVMLMVTIGLFVPYQAMLYPTVRIMSTIGGFRTLWGIILIHVIYGLPYTTLLFRNFYVGVPDEISRAARMEGATFLRIFWSVILPLSTNILVVVAILQFTGIWNDFLLSSIFAGTGNLPMTVQLNNIVSNSTGATETNVNMAAAIITALPPLALYFLSGKYFVRGVAAGAVKG
jgi:ABC-type sugar transport system, permease component